MSTQAATYQYLGKGRKIIDGAEKITGQARYTADISLPGMLHARLVLSPYAHANILSIETTEAAAIAGVVAVLTAQDLPTKDKVIASRNSAVLAKDKVLFRGQPVVVVLGETEQAAQDGADAVMVDYEPLPSAIDLAEAIKDDAPTIWPHGLPTDEVDLTAQHAAVKHEAAIEGEINPNNVCDKLNFKRGDTAQGFKEAEVIIERTYRTATVHQGYLEPCSAVAEPDPIKGSITVYTSTQGQFIVRNEVARLLSLPKNKVRITPMTVGGAFGAKYGIVEPLAAAAAMVVQRPVKLVLTRIEDFLTTTPSPASIIELKTGARADGTLCALEAKVYLDNGIFKFALGGIAGMLLGGYYKCDNVNITCYEVNTNKPQAGAYRAPSAPQISFALESNIDDMAEALGLDTMTFRLKNAAQDGDPMGNNDPWPSLGLKSCLEQLQQHPVWQNRAAKGPNEGVGIAIGGWPCGAGPAASVCRVDEDGTVRLTVGSVDISGVNSSLVLIAAEILGVSPDQVELFQGDTVTGPLAPPSGGSQVTYSVSAAVSNAAQSARKKLLQLAADDFEAAVEDMDIKDGKVFVKGLPDRSVTVAELAAKAANTAGGPGPIIGEGTSAVEKNAPAFVAHLAKVKVDPDTGQVKLTDFVAVQDVGFALNPMLVEGQIHGGVVQGIGWGLHETMVYDDGGELLSASFMDYDMPKAGTVPNIEAIMIDNPSSLNPFGARGVGEPPITAPAAAIANAIKDATGVRVAQLPIRPETLWQALHGNGGA